MTKQQKNTLTRNTSAPASPDTPAGVSATEGAQASSQAVTQAETGSNQPTETVVTPPVGDGSPVRDEAQRTDLESQPKADEPASTAAAIGSWPRPTHIVVAAMKDGFRRAGRAWSKEPTTVSLDEFTREQIEALATEPMLAVALTNDPNE